MIRVRDLPEVTQLKRFVRQPRVWPAKDCQILSRIGMPILHAAITEVLARQLPLVQNVLHGFGGTQTAFV